MIGYCGLFGKLPGVVWGNCLIMEDYMGISPHLLAFLGKYLMLFIGIVYLILAIFKKIEKYIPVNLLFYLFGITILYANIGYIAFCRRMPFFLVFFPGPRGIKNLNFAPHPRQHTCWK